MTVSLINYQARGLTFRGLTDHCVGKQGKNIDLHNKAKKPGSKSDWSKFKTYQKSIKQSLRSTRNKYYADFSEESLKENPKKFWAHIKHLKILECQTLKLMKT